ncbi:hypothetical protein ARAM_005388 [Aspergillus rambellii]|uniref:TATA element modulatory factor 1 TATA binding domain-containing protein n=1 Tax=Aspergillus rambellii TaxID=308745 RepID=A0A0F8W6S0_9EURO|nr:hypothetical protein ARAM_005388 [Aspergillus rambellii]
MSQSKWKVGSFLQQAVAGVESRLDLILAEEEESKQPQSKPPAGKAKPSDPSENASRSSSNARKNDRLQERLARAMVRSNTPGSTASVSSPVTSPVPSNDARSSLDIESSLDSITKDPSQSQGALSDIAPMAPRMSYDSARSPRNSVDAGTRTSIERNITSPVPEHWQDMEEPDPLPASKEAAQMTTGSPVEVIRSSSNDDDDTSAQLEGDNNGPESQLQEEIHGYIERIDALQSKLKYLAQEAAESARNAAATAEPGSIDRQLREKDQKIALLLEEGQKLSKAEMDHRAVMKKLRQQLVENSKIQTEAKKKGDRLERDLANVEARAKRAEAAEKRANVSLSAQMKVSRDLEAVTAERNALSQTVQEMKGQLARAVARADTAEAKAQSDALEQGKYRANQLEEELSSAKIEREINEEKLKREISSLRETIEQEKERARVLEAELKGEQSVLESKMESLRSRAEEASSGVAGDTQAKLLRQIETLQTQYAVASENWQTLEGSLLSRLANVEKERDEIARREGETRRKIRELNLKVKKVEEELENAQDTERDLSNQVEEQSREVQRLEQKLRKATDDLAAAQNELVEQKVAIDATWAQKLEEERAKWRELALLPMNPPRRTESPVAFNRRPSNLEVAVSVSDYRPTSRRSSVMPGASPEIGTPPRQNSLPVSTVSHAILSPLLPSSGLIHVPETPTIMFESDEYFPRSGTPSAFGGAPTQHSRTINDIISESTAGAGPSVQLVERMSATVRRLESERAASKDELARITAQRDEARQQVVDLMREVEEKRVSDTRVEELEEKLAGLDRRYETTLEMLGEKSEQVEELQADIADLKKIYRELVDSTMK